MSGWSIFMAQSLTTTMVAAPALLYCLSWSGYTGTSTQGKFRTLATLEVGFIFQEDSWLELIKCHIYNLSNLPYSQTLIPFPDYLDEVSTPGSDDELILYTSAPI